MSLAGSKEDTMSVSSSKIGSQVVVGTKSEEIYLNIIRRIPRTTCSQMAPEFLRLSKLKQHTKHLRLSRIHQILLKANVKNVDKHMSCLNELDKSETIIPHGEVSKRLYTEIFAKREFDLYGRPMKRELLDDKTENEMRILARRMGLVYKSLSENVREEKKEEEEKIDKTVVSKDPDLFDKHVTDDIAKPQIMTDAHNIGLRDNDKGPVGFASDPAQIYNSEGREIYYSYDGGWKGGLMHGYGTYLFADVKSYKGDFQYNHPDGEGVADYLEEHSYTGEWKSGYKHGKGVEITRGGKISTYDGYFYRGKKDGQGKLEYESGLVYEGQLFNGKPHGRGVMTSTLTNYTYDGTFVK